MAFPKRSLAQESGEIGINIVSKVVTNDLKMIFRRIPQEHDYGLDGYIDFVSPQGFVTGGSVGVQIKYGLSYFKDEVPDGYWYKGSKEHLNYFLNQTLPTFIFLVYPTSEEIYWVEFDPNTLHKSGNSWKILVPKINSLKGNFLPRLELLCAPFDFVPSMDDHLGYKEVMAKMTAAPLASIHIAIRRESIEACDTSGLVAYFEGLKSNKKILKQSQGKVSFFVKGYDEDPRELFEIPEVISYFEKIEPEVKYWFYFLSTNPLMSPLQALMAILCHAKRKEIDDSESFIMDFENGVQAKFFQRNFLWLNEITEFLGLSVEENKRISDGILNYYKSILAPNQKMN